jgi:prepilin-type N-terminal cleavage/methylation domain-containing protein
MICICCGRFVKPAPDGSLGMHAQSDGQICEGTNETQVLKPELYISGVRIECIAAQFPEDFPPIFCSGQTVRKAFRRAFTLIELLVVITIILIISVIALPTVLTALQHRQVSEAARLLGAGLAGARDSAIRTNSPSGIRLLPDPAVPNACNRWIPLSQPPSYTEGLVSIVQTPTSYPASVLLGTTALVLEEAPVSLVGVECTARGQAPDQQRWRLVHCVRARRCGQP